MPHLLMRFCCLPVLLSKRTSPIDPFCDLSVTYPTAREYQNLLKYDWELYMGSGGHHQWQPKHFDESDTEPLPEITMLTTDIALLKDPIYLELVKLFAANQAALDIAFSHAWYKLTTRDMGPAARCLGSLVPPPQPFQGPLPPPPSQKVNVIAVTNDVLLTMRIASTAMAGDVVPGINQPYYGALFVTLAWQCASTFRETDYTGGCNGARIRFSPQKDWPQNVGMDRCGEPVYTYKPTECRLGSYSGVCIRQSICLAPLLCLSRKRFQYGTALRISLHAPRHPDWSRVCRS